MYGRQGSIAVGAAAQHIRTVTLCGQCGQGVCKLEGLCRRARGLCTMPWICLDLVVSSIDIEESSMMSNEIA